MGKTSVASDNSGLASRDKSDKFWDVNGIRLVKIKEISRGLAHRICFASVVTYFCCCCGIFQSSDWLETLRESLEQCITTTFISKESPLSNFIGFIGHSSIECQKWVFTCFMIGPENSRRSLNQSVTKFKPITSWSPAFPALWPVWLLLWFLSGPVKGHFPFFLLIGCWDYFGIFITTLNRKALYAHKDTSDSQKKNP